MPTPVHPRCPACHADCEAPPLRLFTAEEAAQHFVLREEFPQAHAALVPHIQALWGGPQCELRACAACGLQFAWPFVAGDGRFYNLAYPYSDYPSERWEFDETLGALAQTPLLAGPVLEIGSGFGHFLRQLSPRFVPREQVLAIEYNDRARAQLTAQGFGAFGVDLRAGDFEAWRGQLAAVFMFQVLEHMDGLDPLAERINELLQPGASLFIAVPNIERIAHNEAHGSLLDMPPNHISRWTEAAFAALAARAGWQLQTFRRQPLRAAEFAKADLVFAHMRRAQRSGSLANRLRSRSRSRLRVAAEGLLALASVPSRLPGWRAAMRRPEALGDSVWVHLKKVDGVRA